LADDLLAGVTSAGSGMLQIALILIGLILVVGCVAGLLWYYKRWKRYKQFKVVIWAKDSFGQVYEEYDEAGIFVDKATKSKRLWLKRNAVGLEPDNIPYVMDRKGKKMIYMLRNGLKNFFYIKPNLNTEGTLNFSVGEEDINWGVNSYMKAKEVFAKSGLLAYMPFIILAFVCIIILILFVYLFNQFAVLKDIALAFKDASANVGGGTIVTPTGV
jgi:hypothetical protein